MQVSIIAGLAFAIRLRDGSMERSGLGRSVVFIISVSSIASMGQSTFGETTACRAGPGPPAAQGMHWYYRLDRTNNRHCWYLQAAGVQVRSHAIVPLSKRQPQIVAQQSLAPSQTHDLQTSPAPPATAEGVLTEPSGPPLAAPSGAHFIARWPDLPAPVDFSGSDFAAPPPNYAGEHPLPASEEPVLSTQVVHRDATNRLPHKSTTGIKFWSAFIGGAISVILFGRLLKLTRVLTRFLTKPGLKSELEDNSEISLSELMRTLRRVDESFNAAEPRRYWPLNIREPTADARALKRDQLYRLGYPG